MLWVAKRPEQRTIPHTLFSLQRFIISTSAFSSPFETKTRREYPLSLVAFSMAESRSEKNGWAMWGTISPMILEEDLERDLATALG